MIWITRLCGILAAAYLIYLAAPLPQNSAEASDGPAMAMAVSGEMMPAMDAVKYNNLHAYKQRYPLFPAVLKDTRWVLTLDKADTCSSNPGKIWTFSGDGDFGRVCTQTTSDEDVHYRCEEKGILGRKVMQDYTVKFGDPILPDWTLERPHITLIRKGWGRKTIGLRQCEA